MSETGTSPLTKMTIREVMARLPHRYPFLLVDRVLECDSKSYIKVQKNVTINEPCFQGHFPEVPVLPGVLVLESMAQATGILAFEVLDGDLVRESVFMLVGVDNARFKRQVLPGDVLIIQADVMRRSRNMMKFSVTAKIDDALVCSAEIMGAFAPAA